MPPPEAWAVLAAAALLAVPATRATQALCSRLGWVSPPNPLIPQHTRTVAHVGGPAVAVAAAAAWLGQALWLGAGAAAPPFGVVAGVGTAAFLALGVVDDVRPFQPLAKVAWQTALAGAAAALGAIHPFTGLGPIDTALSVAWIVLLVNAVNVTDVCDGFMASMIAVLLLGWAFVRPEHAVWALAAAGGCLGFLVFNRPPATIFLGDAGSHLLGFVLACLLLAPSVARAPAWRGLLQMVLGAGVFLLEVAVLVTARRRRGVPIYRGSPDHVALRLQAAGLSRSATDLTGAAAAALLVLAAWGVGRGGAGLGAGVAGAAALVGVAAWRAALRVRIEAG